MCGYPGLGAIPVICTLPVSKLGRVLLYDIYLNDQMEGLDEGRSMPTSRTRAAQRIWNLDDVDYCLSKVKTVKYNQTYDIGVTEENIRITVTALPSGRTIGGSMWRIDVGASSVLYAVDVNLRREGLLDGADVDGLPKNPCLLIMEGSSPESRSSSESTVMKIDGSASTMKKGKKADIATSSKNLLSTVLNVLRNDGNVLIPCESAGRVLDVLYMLAMHWRSEQGIQQYPLVFLSPMASHVMEYARSQLEWMSDPVCRGFYNRQANPFNLPEVLMMTSIRELDKINSSAPKVVVATDASLNFGLAKELLLQWGGDPRCCVIFSDYSDVSSLAMAVRATAPGAPVVVSLQRPQIVKLHGAELMAYNLEVEKAKRAKDEEEKRFARERELALV